MIIKKFLKMAFPEQTARGRLVRNLRMNICGCVNKKEKDGIHTGFVININRDMTKEQKRVLISYITGPFFKADGYSHTNRYETFQILRYFISRDFVIDIINCNTAGPTPEIENMKYDLIFGLGGVFYCMTKKYPSVNNCMYITENSPDFSNEKETERINYFLERNKTGTPQARTGLHYKNEHFGFAKNALVMGIAGQFEKHNFKNLITINPTGLKNENFTEHCPITDNIRKSFLWFGSRGAVHKGLDILIEIAGKNNDFDLHICGLAEEEEGLFEEAISKFENIHNHGFADVNSQEFIDIVNSVTFMVFPSCSEAMSTSCLTAARHGVLLLLLRNSGMDRLGDHAFWLEDFKVDYVGKRMREVSMLDNEVLTQKSRELQKYADKEFCLERYTENFEKAMDVILDI